MAADPAPPRAGPSARNYEEILRNIHDAVYMLGADGTITWVNEVAVEEFDGGYTRSDLLGAPVTTVLSTADVERCADLIGELIADDPDGSRRCEVDLVAADGRSIPCELHLALLPSADGGFVGTIGVARDVTEQRRRRQGLSVLNRVLRHNLRNELSLVVAGLEGAEAGDDGTLPAARRAVDRLLRTSEKARVVEESLREPRVTGRPVDLRALATSCAAAAAERFPSAEVTVTAPESCWVAGGAHLEAVVDELVENAVVHADDDSPAVAVAVEPPTDDAGRARLVVTDDGPGIPDAELAALERDVESSLEHASGLGLWLVTWVVEALGGELTFERPAAGGTTVRLALPTTAPPGDD